MTARDQLLKELDQTPDFLIEEILDFCLFLRQRQQAKAPQKPSAAQILEAIAFDTSSDRDRSISPKM